MTEHTQEASKCQYKHHKDTYGEEIRCGKCGGPLTCGPFEHRCRKCDPFYFRPCHCGALRIFCTC